MSHLTREQLDHFKQLLRHEKESLEQRVNENRHYGLNQSFRDSTGDLSVNDNHPGDLGSEMFERGKDLALNDRAERDLEAVNTALDMLEQGRYGTCVVCGREIPAERLEAVPSTLYCKEHVPNPHVNNRRPREEFLMTPPFGRTSLDELPEQNQFDGEDAWQIVESWGNSTSPALAEDPEIGDYNDMYIEADEREGYVEPIESFLATDLYGHDVSVVRNKAYRRYLENREGDPLLEPDADERDDLI
jgi:YteA family regulatory protein